MHKFFSFPANHPAHQLWYQVQTILTWDFNVVTTYNRLPLTHSLWAYAVQQHLTKHFSIWKHSSW